MPGTPLVSIVIPTFNGASFIAQSLESVQSQTFQDFEVIIADDGSTDDTAVVARKFCAADARFTLVQQDNRGVSAARNAAIERAQGEFIAFLDHDDLWLPGKLSRQLKLFQADLGANFSFTNYYYWDGRRDLSVRYRDNQPLPEGDASSRLVYSNVYGMSTVVVRHETISATGGFNEGLFDGCEDWDMWLRIAEHGFRACGTREPLTRYRRWSGNMSNHKLQMAENDVRVLERNFRATQRPELRPHYQRSLAFASGRLELARARRLLNAQPDAVPAAVWRAWRFYPRRLKWLMWYGLVAWPKLLGGCATARVIHRKLIRKW